MFSRTLDELNKTLLTGGVACALLGGLVLPAVPVARYIFTALATVCIVFFFIRLLGNQRPERRYMENQRFLTVVTAVSGWFRRAAAWVKSLFAGNRQRVHRARRAKKNPSWSEIRQYKYFLCPQCAQRLRVPRGKGKIRVTCTHCGNVFEMKS